jgi:hypothetical protein
MSAHTVPTSCLTHTVLPGGLKIATMELTLSGSYDAGGSVADFSTAGNLGGALGFQKVYGCSGVGVATAGHANSKYKPALVRAASDAAATAKVKIDDVIQATPAEASGDLSSVVLTVIVYGT